MPGKLRIISGKWRRRTLPVPPVEGLRPTPDRVRETLFNWLAADVEGARCLDLYAGSGALGFEAASRGAARVVLVERDARAVDSMRAQARMLEAHEMRVVQADVPSWLESPGEVFDIVFIDPPYASRDLGAVCARLDAGGWLAGEALVYLETADVPQPLPLPAGWQVLRRQRAGRVRYHLAAAGAAARLDAPAD